MFALHFGGRHATYECLNMNFRLAMKCLLCPNSRCGRIVHLQLRQVQLDNEALVDEKENLEVTSSGECFTRLLHI